MPEYPETRASLLLRLREGRDEQAWREFVEIYEPLIYRLIRRSGLQQVDAQELTQDALVAVAGAIERGAGDFQQGSFRGWLSRIARNMMINYLTRVRPGQRGVGGSDFHRLIQEQPGRFEAEETVFDLEQQRQVFQWAAAQIRGEFQEATWQAFWQTSVEGRGIAATAEALGLSVGSVYAARSRVMAKLKRTVDAWRAAEAAEERDER